jgi:hypothetical protein
MRGHPRSVKVTRADGVDRSTGSSHLSAMEHGRVITRLPPGTDSLRRCRGSSETTPYRFW